MIYDALHQSFMRTIISWLSEVKILIKFGFLAIIIVAVVMFSATVFAMTAPTQTGTSNRPSKPDWAPLAGVGFGVQGVGSGAGVKLTSKIATNLVDKKKKLQKLKEEKASGTVLENLTREVARDENVIKWRPWLNLLLAVINGVVAFSTYLRQSEAGVGEWAIVTVVLICLLIVNVWPQPTAA